MGIIPSPEDEAAVDVAVDVLLEYRRVSRDSVLYALTQRGLEPAVAWRLVQLVPMAFCRVLFRDKKLITFTPTYTSYMPDTNARVARRLTDEPLYVAAVRAAERRAAADLGYVQRLVASYSTEFDVIRKLVEAASGPSRIALTETLVPEYDPRSFIEWSDDVNRFLLELFASHGMSPTLEDGWLVFPDESVRVNGLFFKPEDSDGTVFQLDVRVCLDAESLMIVESFAGFGETEGDALRDARTKFLQGTFHVILAAVFGQDVGDQVTREEWVVGGLPRVVTIGGAVVVARTEQMRAELSAGFEWFGRLVQEIRDRGVGAGTHWIRLFYGQWDNRTHTLEVLLDNAPWDSVQESMAQAPWLPRPEFYSQRLFLILQDG